MFMQLWAVVQECEILRNHVHKNNVIYDCSFTSIYKGELFQW